MMIRCDVCGKKLSQNGDEFVCPNCGWTITVNELEDENSGYDDVPEECRDCDGPYPECVANCPFD